MPSPRSDGSLIYDPTNQRLLMVGGKMSDHELYRELWAFDSTGWHALH